MNVLGSLVDCILLGVFGIGVNFGSFVSCILRNFEMEMVLGTLKWT